MKRSQCLNDTTIESNNTSSNSEVLEELRSSIFKKNLKNCGFDVLKYFETFDKPEKGFNNYADLILNNLKNLNNESDQWTPNLDSEKIISNFIKTFHNPNNESKKMIKISDETRKYGLSVNINSFQIKKKEESLTLKSPRKNVEAAKFIFQPLKNTITENTGTLSFGQNETSSISENIHKRFNSFEPTQHRDSIIKFPKPLKIQTCVTENNVENVYQRPQSKECHDFPFKSAREQLSNDLIMKKTTSPSTHVSSSLYGGFNNKKSLGTRKGARSDFVPPIAGQKTQDNSPSTSSSSMVTKENSKINNKYQSIISDERLKSFQPEMIELILSEIMDSDRSVTWSDLSGLEAAKKILQEIVILPMLRPDIFTGLRGPPKGLLLFGPPGTGKTLIGKCIASHSQSTFFSISASSLTSKWVGEGEKMVRALFAIARLFQPAVIFIDEIDSLLTQRSESEHESSRRMKTEFLVQLDGVNTGASDRLLLVGATNRPQEIDEAARRRFVKRLYIPLPTAEARRNIIENLLVGQSSSISSSEIDIVVNKSEGYSGADIANLCKEAAMGPVRGFRLEAFESMSVKDVSIVATVVLNIIIDNCFWIKVRPISFVDFEDALNNVKSTVSPRDLDQYTKWNSTYGSYQLPE